MTVLVPPTGTSVASPFQRARAVLLSRFANAGAKRSYRLGYVPSLDGLRGFLTLPVMLTHTNLAWFPGGAISMDGFFVLSGYLITSLLIAEERQHGSVDIPKFYRRRLRRLYPGLLGMVLPVLLVSAIFPVTYPMSIAEAAVALAYLRDYSELLITAAPMVLSAHLWSLAVEEQFYLVWPLIFLIVVRRLGVSRRAVCGLLAVALIVAVTRAYLTYAGLPLVTHIYYVFHLRADALLIGCSLAFVMSFCDIPRHPGVWAFLRWLAPVSLALYGMTYFTIGHIVPIYFYAVSNLVALGTACLIPVLVHGSGNPVKRLFESRFMVFCGRISYGLYLWHWPIFVILIYQWDAPAALKIPVAWALVFIIATASYEFLERRFIAGGKTPADVSLRGTMAERPHPAAS